jgi:hypothetical protein
MPEPIAEPLTQRIERELQDALNDCPGPIDGGMIVTKFMVIAEVHTGEDGPILRIISKEGMAMWDEIGMLTFALHDLQHDSLMHRFADAAEDDE